MTNFADNILSGAAAIVSSQSSMCPVQLSRHYNFNATVGSTTLTGVFPSNAKNLTADIYITQQGSATASDKITVSAAGTNLLTVDQFGSATGYAPVTTTSVARITLVASACAVVPAPSTGAEIPYSVTYLKSSANKTGSCQINLKFNRKA